MTEDVSEQAAQWFLKVVLETLSEVQGHSEAVKNISLLPASFSIKNELSLVENIPLESQEIFEEKGSSAPLAEEKNFPLSVDQQQFFKARQALKEKLEAVRKIEILGVGPSGVIQANHDFSYQSKNDAESMLDELAFLFKRYNEAADALCLYHEKIEGKKVLRDFYNKYCYTDNTGLQKLLTFLLMPTLVPLLWWFLKWQMSGVSPTMRQEVLKSISLNIIMPLQLVFDIFAPLLRTILKALLYTLRMILGVFFGIFWAIDADGNGMVPPTWRFLMVVVLVPALWVIKFLSTILIVFPWVLFQGIDIRNVKNFVATFNRYFDFFDRYTILPLLQSFKKSVNPLMEFLSKWVGGIFITPKGNAKDVPNQILGLHRASPLTTMGVAAKYERLAHIADVQSVTLSRNLSDILEHLGKNTVQKLFKTKRGTVFSSLLNYKKIATQFKLAGITEKNKETMATLLAVPSSLPDAAELKIFSKLGIKSAQEKADHLKLSGDFFRTFFSSNAQDSSSKSELQGGL